MGRWAQAFELSAVLPPTSLLAWACQLARPNRLAAPGRYQQIYAPHFSALQSYLYTITIVSVLRLAEASGGLKKGLRLGLPASSSASRNIQHLRRDPHPGPRAKLARHLLQAGARAGVVGGNPVFRAWSPPETCDVRGSRHAEGARERALPERGRLGRVRVDAGHARLRAVSVGHCG